MRLIDFPSDFPSTLYSLRYFLHLLLFRRRIHGTQDAVATSLLFLSLNICLPSLSFHFSISHFIWIVRMQTSCAIHLQIASIERMWCGVSVCAFDVESSLKSVLHLWRNKLSKYEECSLFDALYMYRLFNCSKYLLNALTWNGLQLLQPVHHTLGIGQYENELLLLLIRANQLKLVFQYPMDEIPWISSSMKSITLTEDQRACIRYFLIGFSGFILKCNYFPMGNALPFSRAHSCH